MLKRLTDDEILEKNGWVMECESPLEITDNEGSFAKNRAARIVIDSFHDEYFEEQKEAFLTASTDLLRRFEWGEISDEEFRTKSYALMGLDEDYTITFDGNNHV